MRIHPKSLSLGNRIIYTFIVLTSTQLWKRRSNCPSSTRDLTLLDLGYIRMIGLYALYFWHHLKLLLADHKLFAGKFKYSVTWNHVKKLPTPICPLTKVSIVESFTKAVNPSPNTLARSHVFPPSCFPLHPYFLLLFSVESYHIISTQGLPVGTSIISFQQGTKTHNNRF